MSKINTKNVVKTISVVGLGYVGLPLALLAERKGYKVIGIDRDEEKVRKINNHIAPYEDKNISDFLRTTNIDATSDWSKVKETSIVVVCVPTPVDHNHQPDLTPVRESMIQVAKNMVRGQLIVLESTVNPGVCEDVVIPILEETSGLKVGQDFFLVHCPERINPGDKKWNVQNIPRVLGSFDKKGLKKGLDFYRSIIDADIKPMGSLKEAEAVKVVENSFRDINIAFVNELAQSFSLLGIDVVNVIKGASTKPFSFLAHFPGCGVGGHCIPVDPYYLIEYAKKNGFKHRFLSLARQINNGMPKFTCQIAEGLLGVKNISLKGSKIAVLGLAYKANIDDCRESPSFEIIKYLKKQGALVEAYDPHVREKSTTKNLDDAVHDAKAVIIATAHNTFKQLPPKYFMDHHVEVIVDGQNCLPEEKFIKAGIMYQGIGKKNKYITYEFIPAKKRIFSEEQSCIE